MGLRNACAYSKKYARPYTRKSKVKSRAYIKTIPPQKITKFNMGNQKVYEEGRYKYYIKLISKEKVMLRDNAIEACRQSVHRELEESMPGAYYFQIKKYPHHIIRENRVYSGGSKGERVNTGMQMSFGAAIGRAAFVEVGETIFVIFFVEEKQRIKIREMVEKIKPKLACATKIVLEQKKP